MTEFLALRDVAEQAARAGGAVLERLFRSSDLQVRSKSAHDFVSRADHESEDAAVAVIRAAYPEHDVLGEERGLESAEGEEAASYRWLVDPLDGTTNFLQGLPVFCISVACQHKGKSVAGAVLDPLSGNLFTASLGGGAWWNGRAMSVSDRSGLAGAFLATGYPFKARDTIDRYLAVFRDVFRDAKAIRRCGAAALDLAFVAAGVYDGFFEFRLSPWDVAAGDILIREAGGIITNLDGGADFYRHGNLLAGTPGVHRDLLRVVGQHASEALVSIPDGDDVAPGASPAHAALPDGDSQVDSTGR